jgi:hypothetical protein
MGFQLVKNQLKLGLIFGTKMGTGLFFFKETMCRIELPSSIYLCAKWEPELENKSLKIKVLRIKNRTRGSSTVNRWFQFGLPRTLNQNQV